MKVNCVILRRSFKLTCKYCIYVYVAHSTFYEETCFYFNSFWYVHYFLAFMEPWNILNLICDRHQYLKLVFLYYSAVVSLGLHENVHCLGIEFVCVVQLAGPTDTGKVNSCKVNNFPYKPISRKAAWRLLQFIDTFEN